jgi:nucleotide-binding universal stress UspA family protein
MFKRILLAYDGSESGRRALLECGEVAGLMHADIKLLAVTPSMPPVYVGEGFIPTDSLDAEKERFRDVLDDGIRQLETKGFACQGQLSFGEPVDEIARVAREWGADLIVMGHRRAASWAERWWRGSLSKSLVEIAPCSVLIAVLNPVTAGATIPARVA